MKELFLQPYFWYYISCSVFTFFCQRSANNFRGSSGTVKTLLQNIGNVGSIISIIFIILGFFFMPTWWWPIAMLLLSMIGAIIPIPDIVMGLIGIVVVPIAGVLMYLSLFNVI